MARGLGPGGRVQGSQMSGGWGLGAEYRVVKCQEVGSWGRVEGSQMSGGWGLGKSTV